MTLLVEDGTGMAAAESYISVADADAYHLKMGNSAAWDNADDKEASLRQATEFMRNRYYDLWQGVASNILQRLDWPRWGVTTRNRNIVAINVVPETIKAACAELALRSLSGDLLPDVPPVVSEETIGPLKFKYDLTSPPTTQFLRIDAMLQEFFLPGRMPSGINMNVMRA